MLFAKTPPLPAHPEEHYMAINSVISPGMYSWRSPEVVLETLTFLQDVWMKGYLRNLYGSCGTGHDAKWGCGIRWHVLDAVIGQQIFRLCGKKLNWKLKPVISSYYTMSPRHPLLLRKWMRSKHWFVLWSKSICFVLWKNAHKIQHIKIYDFPPPLIKACFSDLDPIPQKWTCPSLCY